VKTDGRVEQMNSLSRRWSGVKGKKDDDGDFLTSLDLAPGDAELYRW
jgi:hypothetical protein